jgi:hypothetical protein
MRLDRTIAALAVILACWPFASPISAQTDSATALRQGRIVGRVLDATTGDPIAGAQVSIDGTPFATRTDVTGRYTLSNVPGGSYTLTVRTIGYAAKAISGVMVNGEPAVLDIRMTPSAIEVSAVAVTAEAERGSVSSALEEQRRSNQITNVVTAEQIRKSPDSDAGQAVQRVSGVTVQDGKFVFVRGLGERYTTTSLNGVRIPSPEPERKVVPLDLFPSGLLEGITTGKTFTVDQPGDFSGAQVNLRTREFLAHRMLRLSTTAGFNSAATGLLLPHAPTAGPEWLGFAGADRALPAAARSAGNLTGLTQSQLNDVAASFRNVWASRADEGSPNGSWSLSLGGEDPILGALLNYTGSLTYSYGQEVRRDERRALAVPGVSGGLDRENVFTGMTGRTSVLWGGMLNLSTRLGGTNRLALSNTVTQSGDNEAMHIAGFHNDLSQSLDITRLTFTERRVRSHQLRGDHLIANRHALDWSGALSAVRRLEPDRSDLVYQTTIDSVTGASHPYAWFGGSRSATKTFSDVSETGHEGAINYRHVIGSSDHASALKIGLYYRATDRNADTRAFDILNLALTDQEREQSASVIFDGTYAEQGRFFLAANAALGRYSAADRLIAGYAQGEAALSGRVRLIGGVRVERSRIRVSSTTFDRGDLTTHLQNTDLLPSLGATIRLRETQNLRLSASQTLARPEYRELSPTPALDVLGGQSLRGNPDLRRSLIQNLDARWEWYPTPGQVVSIALFAKRFQAPIERILVQRAGGGEPEVSFANATTAHNYGLELEVRRTLGDVVSVLTPFTLFANATLMRSSIRPGNDSISSLTSDNRPMVGQAKYVLNSGLSYTSSGGSVSATVLYNVVGPRIYEAALAPLPDVYELRRHIVDASVQLPFLAGMVVKLDGKNLLDAPIRLTQGTVDRLYYRTGRVFSLGLSWQP